MTATGRPVDDQDPFPFFHLSNLNFDLSSPSSLTSAQLVLAQFNPNYSPDLHHRFVRAFRQRREKNRARIGLLPLRKFASSSSSASADQEWPNFELSQLNFNLDSLDALTSAQLAVSIPPLDHHYRGPSSTHTALNSSFHYTRKVHLLYLKKLLLFVHSLFQAKWQSRRLTL